ncbi:7341_t:CDS:1, partial [Funneliformis caledonium]
ELPFLRHVISEEGIQTYPNKIAVMKNFSVPKDLTQFRGFIALTSYYRRFIKGFTNI